MIDSLARWQCQLAKASDSERKKFISEGYETKTSCQGPFITPTTLECPSGEFLEVTQVKLGSNTTCVDYCPLGWNQDCLASASKLIAAKCNGDNSCDNSQIKPTKCDGSDGGWDQFLGKDYVHVDSEMPAVHLDVEYKCLPNYVDVSIETSKSNRKSYL